MLGKLVVAFTDDQAGRDAVRFAGRLGALFDSRLVVAFPSPSHPSRGPDHAAAEAVREQVTRLLEGVELAAAPAYRPTPLSWPIHALHAAAADEQAGAIVFGTARPDGDRLPDLGMLERIVHAAPCAVAVVNRGYGDLQEAALKRVGVGFSPTPEGISALDLARRIATASGGQVEVVAGVGFEALFSNLGLAPPFYAGALDELFADTRADLDRALAGMPSGGAPVREEIIEADPARALIARSVRMDLLVLGSRAYGPLRHALLGGVSATVMREGRCPVLIVPRGVDPASSTD